MQRKVHATRGIVHPPYRMSVQLCSCGLSRRLRILPKASINSFRLWFKFDEWRSRFLRPAALATDYHDCSCQSAKLGSLFCCLPRNSALDLGDLVVIQRFDGSVLLRIFGLDEVGIASEVDVSSLCGSAMLNGSSHTSKGRTCRSGTQYLPSRCQGTCPCSPNHQ
jgi:hypothetical protein